MSKDYQVFIGVDIGISGGISILEKGQTCPLVYKMPIKTITKNKKNKNVYDLDELSKLFKPYFNKSVLVVQEALSARPGEGVSSVFSLGRSSMYMPAISSILGWDCVEVQASAWKKFYPELETSEVIKAREDLKFLSKDNMAKKVNKSAITKLKKSLKTIAKNATREIIISKFPSLKEQLKYKNSDGLSDSVFICLYAKDFVSKQD